MVQTQKQLREDVGEDTEGLKTQGRGKDRQCPADLDEAQVASTSKVQDRRGGNHMGTLTREFHCYG